jgi:glutamate dehydrogenase/leucine dehydrogenase
VALQGFGNVGYFFAKALKDYPNLRLIAVANSKNTWQKPEGIDVENTAASGVPRPEELTDLQQVSVLPSSAIVGVKADVLVLAALEDAITAVNMHDVKASIVVELANGPISKEAEGYLLERHVDILPDVIANAGGVIVSCLEWQQNLAGEHWGEQQVNQKLADILIPAADAMISRAATKQISLKQAAFELALERLLA